MLQPSLYNGQMAQQQMQLGRLFQSSKCLSYFRAWDKFILQLGSNVKDAFTGISYARRKNNKK